MDITFNTPEGKFNYRVGAAIIEDGRILMVENAQGELYYALGGRVKLHEDSATAIIREVEEETGLRLEIDRMAFCHEDFFIMNGTKTHELSFIYLMKPPVGARFSDLIGEFTDDGERLVWLSIDKLHDLPIPVFPGFFADALPKLDENLTNFIEKEY